MGLSAGGGAPSHARLRGPEERRRHLLHELGAAAAVHGREHQGGAAGVRRRRHRPQRGLQRRTGPGLLRRRRGREEQRLQCQHTQAGAGHIRAPCLLPPTVLRAQGPLEALQTPR